MPGAGSKVLASDTPASVEDTEIADEVAFTSTSYTAGANSCGQTFTAPTSGVVVIFWGGRIETNSINVRVHLSVQVRTGAVIGSGTIVSDNSDESSLETGQPPSGGTGPETRIQASRHRRVSGLTAGAVYNVQTMHKVSVAGNGTIYLRDLCVFPLVN
jgi:hypothetical protein